MIAYSVQDDMDRPLFGVSTRRVIILVSVNLYSIAFKKDFFVSFLRCVLTYEVFWHVVMNK